MNREILLRGKRIDNGEWVYGYAVKGCDKDNQMFIAQSIGIGFFTGGISAKEVIPETVGQYTGLTDKNGNKIFEGDILDVWENEKHKQSVVVLFEKGRFIVSHYALNLLCERNLYSEVIGNIHDNPELLGGVR